MESGRPEPCEPLYRAANGLKSIIGLLALGEWSPATGAVVRSVQAEQHSLATGLVVEPVVLVFAGGGSGSGSELGLPAPVPAITGAATGVQGRQQAASRGGVKLPATLVGVCGSLQARQHARAGGELELTGSAHSAQLPHANAAGSVVWVVRGVCQGAQLAPQSRARAELTVVARVLSGQTARSNARASESFHGAVQSGHAVGQAAVEAGLEFRGVAASSQTIQTDARGELIDTELETLTAILLAA